MNDSPGIAPGHRSWSWTDPSFLVDVQIDTSTLVEKGTDFEYDRMLDVQGSCSAEDNDE
jgi:hypothetical protein